MSRQPHTVEANPADSGRDVVFQTRDVTKVYPMGDVEVHALRGIDLSLYQSEFIVLLARISHE